MAPLSQRKLDTGVPLAPLGDEVDQQVAVLLDRVQQRVTAVVRLQRLAIAPDPDRQTGLQELDRDRVAGLLVVAHRQWLALSFAVRTLRDRTMRDRTRRTVEPLSGGLVQ